MAILKTVAYDFGQFYQIQRSWRNHFTGNVARVKICISVWFVDCLANWYVRREFLCCLFAHIVNVTLWELAPFHVSNESNLSFEASHRKSSSVFDISLWAVILILGSGSIVLTITSLFLSGRCFPMAHSSPYFLLKTQSFYGLTLSGTHKKLN